MTGVRFLFRVTLRRHDLAAEVWHIKESEKLGLVMSADEISPRHHHRAISRRDFVRWRFSAAGRISAWKVLRRRRLKTCQLPTSTVLLRRSNICCQLFCFLV